MKSKFFKTVFVAIIVVVLVLVFDMLTKYLLIGSLIPNVGDQASFIEGFINFVHVQNDGASGGILGGQTALLIVITLVLLAVLIWYYVLKMKGLQNKYLTLLSVAMGMIFSGSLGNLYDRVIFGYVRDFINFQFINFPVFNIADSAITIGVILLVIYFICEYILSIKKEKKIVELEQKENVTISNKESKFNEVLAEFLVDADNKDKNKENTDKNSEKNNKKQKKSKNKEKHKEKI